MQNPERKVKASAGAAAAITFILWVLSRYVFHDDAVPDAVAGIVAVIVPGLVTLGVGYQAKHTHRPAAPTPPSEPPPPPPPPSAPPSTPPPRV